MERDSRTVVEGTSRKNALRRKAAQFEIAHTMSSIVSALKTMVANEAAATHAAASADMHMYTLQDGEALIVPRTPEGSVKRARYVKDADAEREEAEAGPDGASGPPCFKIVVSASPSGHGRGSERFCREVLPRGFAERFCREVSTERFFVAIFTRGLCREVPPAAAQVSHKC